MFNVGSAVVCDYGYTHVRSPHPSRAFRLIPSAMLLENDSSTGDLSLICPVTFRVTDHDGNIVREVQAGLTQTEPGRAEASLETSPLPTGIYTFQVILGENTYYASSQIVSTELVVYDPTEGRVQGAGLSLRGGLRTAAFNVWYKNAISTEPTGSFALLGISLSGNPRLVVATSFAWMVISGDENVAYIAGICDFSGQGGYSFSLEVQDNDNRLINSADRLVLTVFDSLGFIAYELDSRLLVGEIRIRR